MTKSKYTYRLQLLLLLVSLCNNVFSQRSESYFYQYYTTSHGLPSVEIICLAKDHKGFLWIGTASGISRYDGYSFHNYAYTKNNELVGHVNTIKLDAQQRLWVGTGTGLFCFANDSLIKISAVTSLPQGVHDILPDSNLLWLATENGPVKLDINDIDFTGRQPVQLTSHVLKQWQLQYGPPDKQRTTYISKATDGTVYIGQYYQLFRLSHDTLDLVYATNNTHDKINAIFPMSRSKIYFDGSASELCVLENGVLTVPGLKKFHQPTTQPSSPGYWYVGTRGAFYFHPETGTTSNLVHFYNSYVVYPTVMLQDDHFLWLASHDGLVKLKPSIFTKYTLNQNSNSTDYYSVTELRNGKILIGGNRGLVLEKKGDGFVPYTDAVVPRAEVKALYEDKRGWLWAGSGYQGITVIRNGRQQRFTSEEGLHDNSLYYFFTATNGRFYVIGDQGMTEILIGKDENISFKRMRIDPNTTQYAKFVSAVESPDGTIWIAGEEGIFYWQTDAFKKFRINGKELSLNAMTRDKQGNIWIATSGQGILKCAFNKYNQPEIIKQYTEADGLSDMHYLALLVDKDNNIWAGSSKGITVIGRQGKFNKRILNFDESDGFIRPGYSHISLQQVSDGSIWAATIFGFLSFQPNELVMSEQAPLVYITNVSLVKNNQPVSAPNQPQNKSNEFPYTDNAFNVSFTAIDYGNQQNIQYYYKLDGLDSNWKNTSGQRSIGFENLSPGNYTFRVKAVNRNGTWSANDAVYAFLITPPVWQTWWFRALVLLLVAILAVLLIRGRINFIKKRESVKTELQKLKAAGYRERLEIEKIINHFATAMNSLNSIDEILWDVTKNCIAELNFEDCVIYLKDEHRDVLVQKAAWGPKTVGEKMIINPIEIPVGSGIVGSVAATGSAEIITDTRTDKRYIVDDAQRLSEIAVPIVNNGEVLGVIDSEHSSVGFYTERHLEILVTIASLCAGKIDVIKAEQQTREKEMEVLRLNKDFATSQLTALRMQMNPHFIFNALNSVQHFILQGNVVEANKYLSKFSKLQREILHCSNQQFITLEKEIEILNTYLQLEQFRFGDSFTYQLNMTDEIEPVEISIPPMMLQPFVENAIWHGLMPLAGERQLNIFFDLHTDDILLATIRDNGIGRTAAAKLKQHNGPVNPANESKGMSMVQQRLKLLQQQYDKRFDANIADITDVNGMVQGTQVTIKIFIGNRNI